MIPEFEISDPSFKGTHDLSNGVTNIELTVMFNKLAQCSILLYTLGWNVMGLNFVRYPLKCIPAILMFLNALITGVININSTTTESTSVQPSSSNAPFSFLKKDKSESADSRIGDSGLPIFKKAEYNLFISAGLFLCILGDYALLPNPLPSRDLMFGIFWFMTAHFCFIGAMKSGIKIGKPESLILKMGKLESSILTIPDEFDLIVFLLGVIWVAYCCFTFVPAAWSKGLPVYVCLAVCVYGAVILYLVYCSMVRSYILQKYQPCLGIVIFALSDGILSWNMLIRSFWGGDFISITLYWIGILMIGNSVE